MKTVLFVLVSLVLGVHVLQAQTVPRWSVEMTGGSGLRTENPGDVWYIRDRSPVIRFAISRRLGPEARFAPYVSIEGGPDLETEGDAICYPAPSGTCRIKFADNGSFGAGVGARYALLSRVVVGAQVGGGYYDNSWREFVEVNAALRLVSHLAIASTLRDMRWSYRGQSHWFRPVTVGIQIN